MLLASSKETWSSTISIVSRWLFNKIIVLYTCVCVCIGRAFLKAFLRDFGGKQIYLALPRSDERWVVKPCSRLFASHGRHAYIHSRTDVSSLERSATLRAGSTEVDPTIRPAAAASLVDADEGRIARLRLLLRRSTVRAVLRNELSAVR